MIIKTHNVNIHLACQVILMNLKQDIVTTIMMIIIFLELKGHYHNLILKNLTNMLKYIYITLGMH